MTSWGMVAGTCPAVVSDALGVVLAGPTADAMAHTLLPTVTTSATIDSVLDVLLSGGFSSTPSFAMCVVRGDALTVLLRGELTVSVDTIHTAETRVTAHGVQTWVEASFEGVQQFFVTAGVRSSPKRRLAAHQLDEAVEFRRIQRVSLLAGRLSPEVTQTIDAAIATLPFFGESTSHLTSTVSATDQQSQGSTDSTIPAVLCVNNHPNPTERHVCSACGEILADTHVTQVPRPTLGEVTLPDGSRYPLNTNIILGRNPRAPRSDGSHIPRLLSITDHTSDLSRTHARITLEGWRVLLEDLGSTNGTLLIAPDGTSRRIRAGEPALVSDGSVADLGGARVRFSGVP